MVFLLSSQQWAHYLFAGPKLATPATDFNNENYLSEPILPLKVLGKMPVRHILLSW